MNLNSMSIDRLIGLRSRVEAALGAKVVAERRTIETELSKPSRSRVARPDRSRLSAGQSRLNTATPKTPARRGRDAD